MKRTIPKVGLIRKQGTEPSESFSLPLRGGLRAACLFSSRSAALHFQRTHPELGKERGWLFDDMSEDPLRFRAWLQQRIDEEWFIALDPQPCEREGWCANTRELLQAAERGEQDVECELYPIQQARQPITATIQEIVDYWAAREDECGLPVDWADAHERCWRCGYKRDLVKCHIIPASLGGSSDPSNLVLLCSRCHQEAPAIDDPKFMWIWIRATGQGLYDTFWQVRANEEFKKMFGREPFSWIKDVPWIKELPEDLVDEMDEQFLQDWEKWKHSSHEERSAKGGEGGPLPSFEELMQLFREEGKHIAFHFGYGISPATWACLMYRIDEALRRKYGRETGQLSK